MTDDLATWLRAQLDDDERLAKTAGGEHPHWTTTDEGDVTQVGTGGSGYLANGPWGSSLFEVGEHIARHDPARVLAEVDAKRRILDEHTCRCPDPDCQDCGACSGPHHADPAPAPCTTLRLLALPYAGQPGYRDEWRP